MSVYGAHMAQRTPTYPSAEQLERTWAANVKAAREAIGLTLEQAAELLDVRHSTISRWENWRSCIPDATKTRIAGAYGCHQRDLFPWPDQRPPMPRRRPARKAAA